MLFMLALHTNSIYAAEIQNLSIHYNGNNVLFACEIVKSSKAVGYLFNFKASDTDNDESFNVPSQQFTLTLCAVIKRFPTTYQSFMVYAILENGSVSEFRQPVRPVIATLEEILDCFKTQSMERLVH